jgi:UDP-2,3-diacylglucosamine pyrophosphatase LpxH
MITAVREERLLVVSDIHLGNRLFPAVHRHLGALIRFAHRNRYSLCINGDGVDIMQMSLGRLTRELSACYRELRAFPDAGLKVYYVVGNHDILIEHFLEDWGSIIAVPFLNLYSGDLRIRIDHGHLHDEMFLRFPRLYTAVTVIGRWAISLSPRVYEQVEVVNEAAVSLVRRLAGGPRAAAAGGSDAGIPGEHPSFREAAEEVSLRGFDAVIFGHTHHPGHVTLRSGAVYYNTGSWLRRPRCVTIDHGRIWFGLVSELLEGQPRVVEPAAPEGEQMVRLPQIAR